MNYALVTGASKGLGKAIAEELAKRKINVLLTSRSEDLLVELSKALGKKYQVKTHHFAIDLAEKNAPERIFEWCRAGGFVVSILVNNAGYGLSGPLEKYSPSEHSDMMWVNMNAPVQLTHLFLPGMKEQREAYILNIASTASYQAVPGLNLYAASKAFIVSFSRGLRHELKHTPVCVTVVCPGATDTDFISRANITGRRAIKLSRVTGMSAEKVAAIAVQGMFAKKAEVVPGFINKAGKVFTWLFPRSLSERTAARIYKD